MLHRSRTSPLRTFAPVVLALALACCLPSLLAAHETPDTSELDSPEALRAALLEARLEEAATKTRLVKGLAKAAAERTYNQDQYDVQHYDLNLQLFPSTEILSGTVATTALVVGDPISTVELNFDNNMTVGAATVGGVATTFSHAGDILTIDLDRTYNNGETVTVAATYSGNPEGSAFGWSSYGGEDMIWTLSEPYGARTWWPCKDQNIDKAESIDIHVTVPDNGLIVASNGLLLSEVDNGTTRTFNWHSDYPIVTYLVSLAIHPYTRFSDWYIPLVGDPMEIQHFVYPDHYDDVQANYSLVPSMIGIFAGGFGEYPFIEEKYGHAEFTWGGGMEHQTLSSMGGYSVDLISHELAHQWFGDSITCATFHHIWLNEGFATWSEAYWREQTDGFSVYQQYMDAAAYMGEGTIYVENPDQFWTIFDGNLSYNKASWVVHMLRGVVGDTDFFAGLQQYMNSHGFGSATTEQFRDLMESVSGEELDAFFQQWIYGEYFPIYEYSYAQDGTTLSLGIDQVQSNTGLFTMPIDVRVNTTTGTQDFVVQNSQANEVYQLTITGDVESVELDPDDWILCQVRTGVSNPTFDQGILVVNGVHWDTYSDQIRNSYSDSLFCGYQPFSFWDTFSTPSGGYPAALPTPLGHGSVPGDVIGQFSTIVWVGNDYNGDLVDWFETPIENYLELGGNVLLMTRRAHNFVDASLTEYLRITWAEGASGGQELGDCTAVYPGLVDMSFLGTQNYVDVFYTNVGSESTLLFTDTSGFSGVRGIGVIAEPADGGVLRPDGAKFSLLCARPYRLEHATCRANVDFILTNFFGEPYSPPVGAPPAAPLASVVLDPVYPNPFNPQTKIPFELSQSASVELAIYDAAGRLVRSLVSGVQPAGRQDIRWDGTDDHGQSVASGMYFARLKADDTLLRQPMVLVR